VIDELRCRGDPAHAFRVDFVAADDSVRRFHNPILPLSLETDMAYLIASIVFWLLVW
jgi:hypothetical protein